MSADSCIQRAAPPGCSMRRHGTICLPVAETSSSQELRLGLDVPQLDFEIEPPQRAAHAFAVRTAVEVVQRQIGGLHRLPVLPVDRARGAY